jgi:beta-glucosidase
VRLDLPPDADLVDAVTAPPQHGVPHRLEAGQEVELHLRHDVVPDSPTTSFVINVEPPHAGDDDELDRAVALAAGADVAIVVVGTTEEVEREGVDRDSLALPGRQDELVRRVAAANRRTIVVVNAGAPVLLPWAEDVPAVLLTWFGGQEFGHALADVLLGAAEPGGRLPTTWPATTEGLPAVRPQDGVLAYDEGLFIGYRAHDRDDRAPRFPFGHGLGYTEWDYLDVTAAAADDDRTLRVTLRNTGDRRGREIVQVYASRPRSAVERPPRWLAGFATAEADPGETVTVAVAVPARALEHWDTAAHAWAIEPGTFVLAAGRSSRDLRGEAEVTAGHSV